MATGYSVIVKPSAQRELDKLPDEAREEVVHRLAELREEPRPPDALLLDHYTQHYRLYAFRSLYRVIYLVSDKQRRIVVQRIRLRKDAYKGMRGHEG
jgi:mRNA interferase RelE/StbE